MRCGLLLFGADSLAHCPGAILHDLLPECRTRPETLRALAHCKLWALTLHDLGHVFVVCPQLRHDVRRPIQS